MKGQNWILSLFFVVKRNKVMFRPSSEQLSHFNKTLILYFSSLRIFPSMHLPLSLLLLLVAGAAIVCVAVTTSTLHGFRGCAVREFSFVAQKPGCTGLRITTEACWGRCHTWEVTHTQPVSSAAISERLCNPAIVKHEVNDERPGSRPKPRGGRQPILGSDPSAIVIEAHILPAALSLNSV